MPRLAKIRFPSIASIDHQAAPWSRSPAKSTTWANSIVKYDSDESRDLYNRLISEWLTVGQAVRPTSHDTDLTISELSNAYRKFAEGYYVKNGKLTSQITIVQGTIRR